MTKEQETLLAAVTNLAQCLDENDLCISVPESGERRICLFFEGGGQNSPVLESDITNINSKTLLKSIGVLNGT